MLSKRFIDFLKYGKNLTLVEISTDIAEKAGKLIGNYPFLSTMDAIQISMAIEIGADAFFTNDAKLEKIKEIRTLILRDYLLGIIGKIRGRRGIFFIIKF